MIVAIGCAVLIAVVAGLLGLIIGDGPWVALSFGLWTLAVAYAGYIGGRTQR